MRKLDLSFIRCVSLLSEKMVRKPIVGGNWKCNPKGTAEVEQLITAFNACGFDAGKVDVVIAPIGIHLPLCQAKFDPKIQVCCQNCSKEGEGAFTGEITVGQMLDLGINWTLIGHSERRTKYGESNDDLAKKVAKAQEAGINMIFCIGELLEERQAGKTAEVCRTQLLAVAPKIKDWSKVVIAYEPVWAIGTGVTASVEQAQDSHAEVRKIIEEAVSADVADAVRIQYGGSVTPENCEALIACADVDGFLVGGASLKPNFTVIISAAEKSVP